ncbi:MAG: His-Xaa-Ser system radical SAM maturase HxsC [Pseudomonadota bacterium]
MIPLAMSALAEADAPFVTRLRTGELSRAGANDSVLVARGEEASSFAGAHGLLTVATDDPAQLHGDVVIVDPEAGRIDRVLRAGSLHNTLLVTERCDQLCVMCSQPPKKTHHDRFAQFEQACLLAEEYAVIGVSGGEPTLYKDALLGMMMRVLEQRPDLAFHVLSNAQHFEEADVARLRHPVMDRVTWGIPLYAADAGLHDRIVGKAGAFARLEASMAVLALSGARIELRTVVLQENVAALAATARYVATRLRFIEAWSIMQLEHTGFARNRWGALYYPHAGDFSPIEAALDEAALRGLAARLFNFPRCTVPEPYRYLAVASISDWKRKYVEACASCSEKSECCGFFDWHPDSALEGVHPL